MRSLWLNCWPTHKSNLQNIELSWLFSEVTERHLCTLLCFLQPTLTASGHSETCYWKDIKRDQVLYKIKNSWFCEGNDLFMKKQCSIFSHYIMVCILEPYCTLIWCNFMFISLVLFHRCANSWDKNKLWMFILKVGKQCVKRSFGTDGIIHLDYWNGQNSLAD